MGNITNNKSNGKTYSRLSATVDGRIVRVSLGSNLPKPSQRSILAVVDRLEEANAYKRRPSKQLLEAFGQLPDAIQTKLAKIGLVESAQHKSLPAFLDEYEKRKEKKVKPQTLRTEKQTYRLLNEHFGDVDIASITEADAEDFREFLVDLGHATATVSKNVVRSRSIFKDAIKRGHIFSNPFQDVETGSQVGKKTLLPKDLLDRLVDGMEPNEWRCMVAFYRWMGCRTGEALILKWSDIDWENGRITITSPKTEGHEGGETRDAPLFEQLRPYLVALREDTPEDVEYVYNEGLNDGNRQGLNTKNVGEVLRYRAAKIGIDITWKPIQALRQTRENELIDEGWPPHKVHSWIGHDAETAAKHYLDTADADFLKAAGITNEPAVDSTVTGPTDFGLSFGTDTSGTEQNGVALNQTWDQKAVKTTLIPALVSAIQDCADKKITPLGFEPRLNEPESLVLPLHYGVIAKPNATRWACSRSVKVRRQLRPCRLVLTFSPFLGDPSQHLAGKQGMFDHKFLIESRCGCFRRRLRFPSRRIA